MAEQPDTSASASHLWFSKMKDRLESLPRIIQQSMSLLHIMRSENPKREPVTDHSRL